METNVNVPSQVEGTDPAPAPITPEDLVAQLRTYRERIPGYGQLTIAQSQQRVKAANLKSRFVVASINAMGASQTVQSALSQSPADLVQQQDDIVRWSAVEDELRAMLKGVVSANLVRRHRLGTVALQTYALSRSLVRQPDHADLLPHVQEMERLSKHRKKAETTTNPAPKTPSPVEPHPATPQS